MRKPYHQYNYWFCDVVNQWAIWNLSRLNIFKDWELYGKTAVEWCCWYFTGSSAVLDCLLGFCRNVVIWNWSKNVIEFEHDCITHVPPASVYTKRDPTTPIVAILTIRISVCLDHVEEPYKKQPSHQPTECLKVRNGKLLRGIWKTWITNCSYRSTNVSTILRSALADNLSRLRTRLKTVSNVFHDIRQLG
jgi:hypothetical protein